MEKIVKKVPVIYVGRMPNLISHWEKVTFDLCFTLSSKIQISCPDADVQGNQFLKFKLKDTGNETASLLVTSNLINSKFSMLSIEIYASDIQKKNPDYVKPVPDPDGEGPETGVEGTPDLPPFISVTDDMKSTIIIESIDESLETVRYVIPITIKPKTYKLPSQGLLLGPALNTVSLDSEHIFLQLFKMNHSINKCKLKDIFKDPLIETAPTEGEDKISHKFSFYNTNRNGVITLEPKEFIVTPGANEGVAICKLITSSADGKVVKVPHDTEPNTTVDYTMPKEDRTVTHYFNFEVSYWFVPPMKLHPTLLQGRKGESAYFKLDHEDDGYNRVEYSIIPSTLANINPYSRRITFAEAGMGTVRVTAFDKNDMRYNEIEAKIFVEDSKDTNPIKIMLHNTDTNRLVTIKGNNKCIEDMVYTISSTSGKAITKENMNETNSVISKPVILTPLHNATDHLGDIISSKFEANYTTRRLHVGTIWEFSSSPSFQDILDSRQRILGNGITLDDLYRITPPINNCNVWVRVRYIDSEASYSDWSDAVMFKSKAHNTEVGGDAITDPSDQNNNWDGCFYKTLISRDLVYYNYRGNFETLFNNNLKGFKQGMQVTFKGKKYNSKIDIEAENVKFPGTDDSQWEEDNRSNLPHPKNLIEMYGMSIGFTDNNLDGYSFFQKGIGDIQSSSTEGYDPEKDYKGWMFPDNEYGWLKFGYRGKILYILNKPVCEKISWNDIAKREGHDGLRTVRLGKELYRLRLLTKDEYNVLLKKKSKLNNNQLGIKKDSLELLMDNREDSEGRLVVTDQGAIKEIEHGKRDAVWRPVLEWIRPGTEPFLSLPWSPLAENERFVYDPITDTGYFGKVLKEQLCDYEQLRVRTNIQTGYVANKENGDFLKFYWHGKVIYITRKHFSYQGTWRMVELGPGVFVTKLGRHSGTILKLNNIDFRVGVPTGCKWAIPINIGANQTNELGRYSMHDELLMRAIGPFSTGPGETGGHQIGDNWAVWPLEETRDGQIDIACQEVIQDDRGNIGIHRFVNTDDKATYTTYGPSYNEGSDGWSQQDDGIMMQLQTPIHTYIDSSYFDQFKVIYTPAEHSSGGGIMNSGVIDNVLAYIYNIIEDCRYHLQLLNNQANENPYNPRTLKANWKYPPCIRYTGGEAMWENFSPVEYWNCYFKGARWEGESGARQFWFECCHFITNNLGYNSGPYDQKIASPYLSDCAGNDVELKLSSCFESGEEPITWISGINKYGNMLVFYVDLYNKLIDQHSLNKDKLTYV